jgi:hypothetical protein
MSFFDTEEAHAVMLANGTDEGGRCPSDGVRFPASGDLWWRQAPAWISGREQAHSQCLFRCKKRHPYPSPLQSSFEGVDTR